MENPMNFASLKLSGRFLVLMAYNVHMMMKNATNEKGTTIALVLMGQERYT